MKTYNLSIIFIALFFVSLGFVLLKITEQRFYPPPETSGVIDPPNNLAVLESAPGNGSVVYVVAAGTKVKIHCVYGDYYLVETECGKRGFIRRQYIKIETRAQKVFARKSSRRKGILCIYAHENSNRKTLISNAGNYALCPLYEVIAAAPCIFLNRFDARGNSAKRRFVANSNEDRRASARTGAERRVLNHGWVSAQNSQSRRASIFLAEQGISKLFA